MAPPKASFPNAISVQTGACLQAPVHIGTHRHILKHKQALWAALPPNYELDHSVASTISSLNVAQREKYFNFAGRRFTPCIAAPFHNERSGGKETCDGANSSEHTELS